MDNPLNTDICQNRHGGNTQSIAANKKVGKMRDRAKIIEFLKANGKGYSKQIARNLDKPLNTLSGRFSELLRDGVIERTGEVVEGCAVLRLKH